ncbi:ATP-binding cassette domain-containing protein [Azorhizobium sp. AG788]|uniref:ATP-binding cassette domain-containing protein n=1 Tax=Azorhizobium sp. AG788 TaxID=2183897 RepID=UPI0031399B0B
MALVRSQDEGNAVRDFGGFKAVSNVDFDLREGAIQAVIGPNGAGKSTLFNLLTKFLAPSAGRITHRGEDVTRLKPPAMARRGVVRSFQISAVFAGLSVRENVELALLRKSGRGWSFLGSVARHPAIGAPADELIHRFGLTPYAQTRAANLSYGRKRVLELATTLALDPEVLLLDEPMAGLGREDIGRVTQLIREAGQGRTIRTFTVMARRAETAEVVALRLAPLDGAALPPFHPGQSVTVSIDGSHRSYSLTGAAEAQPRDYTIAVRRLEGGAVSPAVTGLRVGARVELSAPSGSFRMPLENAFPVVLIAAGIGITPFLSYLETLATRGGGPRVILHHACRDGSSHPFADRLQALARQVPGVQLITHYSRPRPGDVCDGEGRFHADLIPDDLLAQRPRFYVCAGDAMTTETIAVLTRRGVPPFEIFQERFTSSAPKVLDGSATHRVTFARSGVTLTWAPPDGSLLTLATRAGLTLASGCRVGQCESCMVSVISGTLDHLIASAEIDPGTCLTCQAVPTSDLVLEA